jgi:hypothetical protein
MKNIFAALTAAEAANLIQATSRAFDKIERAGLSSDDRHSMWCDNAFLRAHACEAGRNA